MSHPARRLVIGAITMALTAMAAAKDAQAVFVGIDDFGAYTMNSAINGQGTWIAASDYKVMQDPLDPGNKVLGVSAASKAAYNNDSQLRITNGTTATLFYRFYASDVNTGIGHGMSDLTAPSATGDFEAQVTCDKVPPPEPGYVVFRGNDGGTFDDLFNPVEYGTWYNLWLVIDNNQDQMNVYLQGGDALASQTLLNSGDPLGFRNGQAANNLVTLFLRSASTLSSNFYIDDIYIDTAGANLASPMNPIVPEPGTLALLFSGLVGLGALQQWKKSLRRAN